MVAIGNFDGYHLGHREVITQARKTAQKMDAPLGLLCFDPHPVSYFKPNSPYFMLTTSEQRAALLREDGVDFLIEHPFDHDLVQLSPEEFVDGILCRHLKPRAVATGFNFTFGHKRSGNVDVLRTLCESRKILTLVQEPYSFESQVVSSSLIRRALREGRVDDARVMLNRPWAIEGKVIRGDRRGHRLGFPTANLDLGAYLRPRYGVYVVRVDCSMGRNLPAIANIGIKPSIGGKREGLEVHLFDFDQDLYDQKITVYLIDFLRPEQRFDDLEALKAQIKKDCDQAKDRLLTSADSDYQE